MDLRISMKKKEKGKYYLPGEAFPKDSNVARLNVTIEKDGRETCYPIFQQAARKYGAYDDYMEHHGCACCSLTTALAAYSDECRGLTPDQTVSRIEKNCFTGLEWHSNYDRPMRKQMPVSFYGISVILKQAGIPHNYIMSYDRAAGELIMKNHLEQGHTMLIETSRIRYKGKWIASINDRKYSGSYHTMMVLGIEEDRETVWFTDSAYRDWSGSAQRLKRAKLSDLLLYMFPCKNTKTTDVYYSGRRNTGGYILIQND